MSGPIKYKAGYKYQLVECYSAQTPVRWRDVIDTDYIRLMPDGWLLIRKGYAWDGATFFPDFDWIVRGSLIHDALYQLIRERRLPVETKEVADYFLAECCKEDQAWNWQAGIVEVGVKRFGDFGVRPENCRPVLIAPRISLA